MSNFLIVHYSNVHGAAQSEAAINISQICLVRDSGDPSHRAVISLSAASKDLTVDESYEEIRNALNCTRARDLPRSSPRPTPPSE